MALPTIDDRLAALAQLRRLAVYRQLVVAGPTGRLPGDIAAEPALPGSSLSFHLAHLKRAGLVAATRPGRSLRYVADFAAMRARVDALTDNCGAGAASTTGQDQPGDTMRPFENAAGMKRTPAVASLEIGGC